MGRRSEGSEEGKREGAKEGRKENPALTSWASGSFLLRAGVRAQTRKGVEKEVQKRWGKGRKKGKGRM